MLNQVQSKSYHDAVTTLELQILQVDVVSLKVCCVLVQMSRSLTSYFNVETLAKMQVTMQEIQGSQADRQPAVSNSAVSMLEPSDWLVAWLFPGCLLAAWLLPSRFPASFARRSLLALAEGVLTDFRD